MARAPDSRASSFLKLIPPEYAQGVGAVTSQWAWAEAMINQLIWRLLGVRSARGRIVTSNIGAQTKIHMLAALMRKSRMDERLVKKIETDGKALAIGRNLVAHGYLAVWPDQPYGIAYSYLARGKLQDRRRLVTPTLLNDLAEHIASFSLLLMDRAESFPKQRGQRPKPDAPVRAPRRLRLATIVKQLPPPLRFEDESESSEEQALARAEKRAKKLANDRRAKERDPGKKAAAS